jgi:uncharacterized protein YeaO (DUF488 family)
MTRAKPTVHIKRVYEAPSPNDGFRVLVDRLWPRGLTRAKAKLDAWTKDAAPSTALRQWFHRDPKRWDEFRTRYKAELASNTGLGDLRALLRGRASVTLLYGATTTDHNHAIVLREALGPAKARPRRISSRRSKELAEQRPESSAVQSGGSLAQRQAAASKYKPKKITLLLVAEAPPCTPGRYFYFEHLDRHDWLFRYVWEGLMGDKPDRSRKAEHLTALREAGVYMIDLHEETISQPSLADLRPHVPRLIDRCRALKPGHIALVKSSVYGAAFEPLRAAGLQVIDERIPFPASGQQRKFLDSFRRAAAVAGRGHQAVR